MNSDEKGVRRLLRRLKKELPPTKKVVLKFVESNAKDLEGCYGNCLEYEDKFLIKIVKDNFHIMYMTLVHEYAHILHYSEDDFHCEEWAIAYGLCYQVHLKSLED